jgi:hypothetical protein
MRRTMRKTMLGKVSQSMSTPGVRATALPARRIAAAIWRMLVSGDTMST